jgi:hypothetical protein
LTSDTSLSISAQRRAGRPSGAKVRNERLGILALALASALGIATSCIVIAYLPEHQIRWVLAGAILLMAPLVGLILNRLIRQMPDIGPVHAGIVALLCVAILLPLASAVYPQRVTYSRFGLTVWGAIPIPYLDVRVNSRGLLWFRPKTHLITMDEVKPLISADVDVLVIGTGWQEIVQVDRSVRELTGCEVQILSTPDAYAAFNRRKAQGERVVLLAHSTC